MSLSLFINYLITMPNIILYQIAIYLFECFKYKIFIRFRFSFGNTSELCFPILAFHYWEAFLYTISPRAVGRIENDFEALVLE